MIKLKNYAKKKTLLQKKICIALHGYGTEVYYAKDALREAERELARAIEVVDYHKQRVAKLRQEENK